VPDPLVNGAQQPLQLQGGRIAVDADRQTSLPGVFAGGDCVFGGQDLTVQAVQDGKLAAHAIDRYLRGG
jgi:glutamate synthase (NADPH/NADH) small chain